MAEKEKQTEQAQQVEVSSVDKLVSLLDTEQKSAVAEFIGKVGKEAEVFRVTGALLDSYIADIDTVLSAQVDEILHNQEFQELESTWRGLHYLVQNTEFSKPVKFELLEADPSSAPYGSITEKHTRRLEQDILEHPEYYLWTHRRWKRKRSDYGD